MRRSTSLRRWLNDLITEARLLSPARRLALAMAAVGTLAFAGWLVVGLVRGDAVWATAASGPSQVGVGDRVPSWPERRADDREAIRSQLRRSVEALAPVEAAEIQLALPEAGGAPSLRPTASVVLRLRDGAALDEAQLLGVRQLVASGAPGLVASDVSVLDASGRLLASPATEAGTALVPRDPERELRLERELAARAESLLAHTVGSGRVAVRVRAELDWSQREETREVYDPDGQVERSEERLADAASAGKGPTARAVERVEYDVGKQVTRASTPAGAVQRLHVAVLVDGKPSAGRASGTFTPWSAAELAQLEALAKQAVGFSAERGDELTLTSAPFDAPIAPFLSPELWGLAAQALRAGALLAALGLLVFGALRAFGGAVSLADLPMTAGALEAELLAREGFALEAAGGFEAPAARASASGRGSASLDADAGAAAVRTWLSER